MHGDLIRSLQERAARAQPALHTQEADGWLLRHAPGRSWWIGSVLPHTGGEQLGELARRITHAEGFYAAREAVARFQITPGACAQDLDALLDARGYVSHAPVSLQITETGSVPPPPADWGTAGGTVVEEHPTHAVIKALLDGEAVSEARAVTDTGWTGIFGMATLPAARGKGAARAVLAALARWAPTDRLYLQVERGNTAARALYRQAGFSQLCEYHYRSRK